ncbi:MAG: hypothetical protein UZ13_03418 [Chloroflexi bacterium OLB13]|nr:MAG: hypothetical protein UZ13_03418 [Chloroflexi bacterium OLB13]
MLSAADKIGFPHRREIVAVVVAVLPFILNFYSVSTVNGRITSYSDFADIVLGAIVLYLTFNNRVFITEGEAKYKVIRIVLTVALVIVGVFHVLSGAGLLVNLPYPLGYGS